MKVVFPKCNPKRSAQGWPREGKRLARPETLDAAYQRYQDRVDMVVAKRGYTQGLNWLAKSFPGQKHNEISWASRVDIPLTFLLPPLPR